MTDFIRISAPSRSDSSANSIGVLRYLLAVLIVLHHMNGLMGLNIPLLLRADTVVYAFFALSGFFAWKSYSHTPYAWTFIRHRLLRLLPPYWAVVILSAVGFSAVSVYSVSEYFTSVGFWKYLGANSLLLNFLAPELPGVFTDHLLTVVNGSLWYVKLEVAFTFVVPLFDWSVRVFRRLLQPFLERTSSEVCVWCQRALPWGVWLAISMALFAVRFFFPEGGDLLFRYLCDFVMFLSGLMMSYAGLKGGRRCALGKICFLGMFFLGIFVGWRDDLTSPFLYYLFSTAVIWILIVLFLSTGVGAVFNRNNMTYSVYLCHFPLIQLSLCWTTDPVVAGLISVLLIGLCAPLLYHGLERR